MLNSASDIIPPVLTHGVEQGNRLVIAPALLLSTTRYIGADNVPEFNFTYPPLITRFDCAKLTPNKLKSRMKISSSFFILYLNVTLFP
jgi:hypothetical protein